MNSKNMLIEPKSFLQGQEMEMLTAYVTSHVGALKLREVALSNISTRYIEGGQGKTAILLHGIGSNKAYFRSLMKDLAKEFRVIAPDVPGLYSEARFKRGKHNFRVLSQWLEEFISALGCNKVTLVGNSMGCNLAAYHAYKFPEKVEKLCLLSMPETFTDKGDSIRTIIEDIFVNFDGYDDVDRLMNVCFYRQPNLPFIIKKRIFNELKKNYSFLKQLIEELNENQIQLKSRIPYIKQPTLLVSGENDPTCPVEFAHRLHASVPNSTLHILSKSKHFTFLERHVLVKKLLMEFIG